MIIAIFKSYKNDSQRHISVGHSNIGNSSLVEDGEIIMAKSDILRSILPIVVEVLFLLRRELRKKTLRDLSKVTG